ncbi:hypothetical protein E2P81_ATG01052 [Venturia nashicola]|nr:hypothetical protein E2P81_ATG01052 [Venturia nashicola]
MTIDSTSPAARDDSISAALDSHQSLGLDWDNGGTTQSRSSKGAVVAVAVACIACRSRHLKCDGGTRCSRCLQDGTECLYVKSRRGWKGPRRQARSALPRANDVSSMTGLPQSALPLGGFDVPVNLDQFLPGRDGELVSTSELSFMVDSYPESNAMSQLIPNGLPTPPTIDPSNTGLLAAYYVYFHPGHPFLLPKPQMLELLNTGQLAHLMLAIQYIGSLYVPPARRGSQEEDLQNALAKADIPRDGIMVQAMLLYSIGLHISDHEDQSAEVMRATIDLALELGMDKRDFAVQNGSNSAIMEESFRRTWWEVFVLDGLNAGVNPQYTLRLLGHQSHIDLPCEERDYASGRIPPIHKNLSEFDDNVFANQEHAFSSSAYRIDAIRLLHKVFMASCGQGAASHLLDSADVHLRTWALQLPVEKRNPIDRMGCMDEVLFEAHMIVSACTIMLHRPRSDLNLDEVEKVKTCVAAHGSTPLPGGCKDVHTVKAMQAARDISGLVLLPCPMIKHTPFFSCAVTMSSIVFLSYWSFIALESDDAFIKDNVKLNIGVLKTLGELWPIANTVLGQVKGVAQELFQSRKALSNAFSQAQVTRQEIFQGMVESVTPPGEDDDLYGQFLALPQIS